jgi:hypothetical protein
MPDYFVFWDEIAGRVRIHRADCEVCKFGKGARNRAINEARDVTSDWSICLSSSRGAPPPIKTTGS